MKSNRKKTLLLSVVVAILFIFSAAPAFAAKDAILSIRIDAALRSDGSVAITEVWNVHSVHSDTGYYKALNHIDGMSVHSFTVKDESGTQYETLNTWSADRSKEEKADTYNILETSDDYELCWGIDTYGDHQYTIQYVLDGLIRDYGDCAEFYHQFVSDLSNAPESVSVEIRMTNTSLTESNARVWRYGFPGEVQIADSGILTASSSEPLGSGDYVNLLYHFGGGLFPQATKTDISFEDLQKNVENEESPIVLYILDAIFTVLVIGGAAAFAPFFSCYKLTDGTAVRLTARDQVGLT